MSNQSKKGFYYSALLHGVVFLLMAAGTLLSTLLKRPEPPHVFRLSPPPLTDSRKNAVPLAEIEPMRLPMDLPALETAPPLPKPKPVRKPVVVEKKPEAKAMSHDQFVKNYSNPKPVKKKNPTTRNNPPPTVIPIDVSGVAEELTRNLSASNSTADSAEVGVPEMDRVELQAFQDQVYGLLDRVWKKPQNLSGDQYTATVRFVVTEEGRILFREFLRESGNELFDTSVKNAFSSAGTTGNPPGGQSIQMTLTFRLTD